MSSLIRQTGRVIGAGLTVASLNACGGGSEVNPHDLDRPAVVVSLVPPSSEADPTTFSSQNHFGRVSVFSCVTVLPENPSSAACDRFDFEVSNDAYADLQRQFEAAEQNGTRVTIIPREIIEGTNK